MKTKKTKPSIRILVLQRGWVVVAEVHDEPGCYRLERCRVIRRWGRPLAELATLGPLPDKTMLEQPCTCYVDSCQAVILQFRCADLWEGVL